MVKKFQGSWCIFVILLCLAILPGIIYYLALYREVEPTVIVAPQPAPGVPPPIPTVVPPEEKKQ